MWLVLSRRNTFEGRASLNLGLMAIGLLANDAQDRLPSLAAKPNTLSTLLRVRRRVIQKMYGE